MTLGPTWTFPWRMVVHRRRRTLVAAAGVGFATLFMFMQLGFHGAVLATAVAITQRLDADLVLVSSRYLHLGDTETFPRGRLFQALAVPGVRDARPAYMRYARWRDRATGRRCSLYAVGFPLDDAPLRLPGLTEDLARLQPVGSLLVDRRTQPKCGPIETGTAAEVQQRDTQVAGHFEIGVGFLGDGALLMSDQTFAQLFAPRSLEDLSLGLVRLAEGANAAETATRLRAVLPPDTQVMTRQQLEDVQIRHWVRDTSIGNLFSVGGVVGFLVGLISLHQVLSTDIRSQLPQYATLKAMGYPEAQLQAMVMRQAWIFGLLGYVPALVLSAVLYGVIFRATLLPIEMTAGRALMGLGLGATLCTLSGLASARRLRTADPAELF